MRRRIRENSFLTRISLSLSLFYSRKDEGKSKTRRSALFFSSSAYETIKSRRWGKTLKNMKRTTSAFCPAALLFFSTKETISFVAIGMGRNARGSSSWSLFAAVRRFPTGMMMRALRRISDLHVRLNCEERLRCTKK
jgi:hypothetical protein